MFIKFIKNLSQREGWYFRKHYMHSIVKIHNSTVFDIPLIQELVPYLNTLKSVQVSYSNMMNEKDSLDTIFLQSIIKNIKLNLFSYDHKKLAKII